MTTELEPITNEEIEKEIEYTPIVKQILGIEEQLQDLDDYFNSLSGLQSQVDEELSDLLHYIENNDLTPRQCSKIVALIKKKRLIRRGLCNDYEIKKVYDNQRSKLAVETQRPFFLAEIHKKAKALNQQYRYRQFGVDIDDTQERKEVAEEEIKNLLK